MTPTEAKELLPMIKAYAEGEKLQFRFRVREHFDDVWSDCPDDHSFAAKFEYRIKPKAFKLGGREVEFRDDGSVRFSDGEILTNAELSEFWQKRIEASEKTAEWPKYWSLRGGTPIYRAFSSNDVGSYWSGPDKCWLRTFADFPLATALRNSTYKAITPSTAAEILGISINELTKP